MKLLLTLLLLSLTACAGGAKVSRPIDGFAKSMVALTDTADELVDELNRNTIQAQLYTLTRPHLSSACRGGGGANCALNGFGIDELLAVERPFDQRSKNRLRLIKAIKALGNYARALSQLAEVDNKGKLAKANIALNSSLRDFEELLRELAPERGLALYSQGDLGLLAGAISSVGNYMDELARQQALHTIISKSDGPIKTLVELIVAELDEADFESWMTSNRLLKMRAHMDDYKAKVRSGAYAGDVLGQQRAVLGLWQQAQLMEGGHNQLLAFKVAIKKIARAHAQVAAAVNTGEQSGAAIVAAGQRLRAAKAEYEAVRDQVSGCKKLAINKNDEIICKDKRS